MLCASAESSDYRASARFYPTAFKACVGIIYTHKWQGHWLGDVDMQSRYVTLI